MQSIFLLKLLKPIFPISLLIFLTSACDYRTESDRFKEKPKSQYLHSKITINEENQTVPVTVYIGPMEENNVRYDKNLSKYVKELWLETDTYYTIVARYKLNGKTYRVVNGITLSVAKSCETCSKPYYYVEQKVIDLRFKP